MNHGSTAGPSVTSVVREEVTDCTSREGGAAAHLHVNYLVQDAAYRRPGDQAETEERLQGGLTTRNVF